MTIKTVIIELYGFHVSEYLTYMHSSDVIKGLKNSNVIIYHGWSIITRLIAMLYSMKQTKQQIHSTITRTYYLYLEYVEKIHTKNMCEHHSPSVFVYNQIAGDICLNNGSLVQNKKNHTPSFIKLMKWSELLLLWNNLHFTFEQRLLCSETFLHSYLTILCNEAYYHSFRLLEILQDNWKDKKTYSELHIRLLHAFLSRIQNKENKFVYSHEIVKTQCFHLFVERYSETQQLIQDATDTQNVDDLVDWILTIQSI